MKSLTILLQVVGALVAGLVLHSGKARVHSFTPAPLKRERRLRAANIVEFRPRMLRQINLLKSSGTSLSLHRSDEDDETSSHLTRLQSLSTKPECDSHDYIQTIASSLLLPSIVLISSFSFAPIAAAASSTVSTTIPSALWAYCHYASILVIFGCLATERTLVKANMAVEDEELVVKLDVVYGIMAALLIISGLFRATDYGKGSSFYLHEPLFWVKMIVAGIWGGLSIFPSITFYKRNFDRQKGVEVVPPISEKLAARLVRIINAELTAVLSIPLLATLMARGVGYQESLYWPAGLVMAILATIASFYLYAQQALAFAEEE